jgi:hypothetical protein
MTHWLHSVASKPQPMIAHCLGRSRGRRQVASATNRADCRLVWHLAAIGMGIASREVRKPARFQNCRELAIAGSGPTV